MKIATEAQGSEVGYQLAEIGVRLLDDAYIAWFTAESECERMLRGWLDASSNNRAAYLSYRAALDREEAAARDLQRLAQLAGPCCDCLGVATR